MSATAVASPAHSSRDTRIFRDALEEYRLATGDTRELSQLPVETLSRLLQRAQEIKQEENRLRQARLQ